MIHQVEWLGGSKLKFPKGTEDMFKGSELETHANFVEGEIDYLHTGHSYDFAPEG